MERLKFSIVTMVLNRRDYMRQAIENVLSQNYANFEHIVIDGGSTDGTVEVLKSYPHLVWISEPDKGSGFALNKGLALITGDVWGWLNSDESYLPGVLHRAAAYLENHADWDVIYGASEFVNERGEFLGRRRSRPFKLHRQILGFNLVAVPSSAFVRCDALRGVGGKVHVEQWRYAYDHDLWIRLGQKYRIQNVPDCFSRFGLHPDSGIVKAQSLGDNEMLSIRRHHGGEEKVIDRIFWVNYQRVYVGLYRYFKWRRMTEKASAKQ